MIRCHLMSSFFSDDSLSSHGSVSPSSSTGSMESPHPLQSSKDIFFQVKQDNERRNLIVDVMKHNSEQVGISVFGH